jgi:hypothetical protein
MGRDSSLYALFLEDAGGAQLASFEASVGEFYNAAGQFWADKFEARVRAALDSARAAAGKKRA